MKYLYLILSIIFISSCSSVQKLSTTGEKYKVSKEMNQFLLNFENAARNHKKTAMLSLMDRAYKKEQHDEMLEGRTDQFFSEFFAGNLVSGKGFKAIPFETINLIKFISIKQTDEDTFDVVYIVKSSDIEVKKQWQIILRNIKGKTVYGLVGAFG